MMTYTATQTPLSTLTVDEKPLVTIEFAPNIHPDETEYNYPHPQFVFGDRVINKFNPSQILIICALELIEPKTPSGRLLNQPRWKYKVNDESWYEESVLIRQSDTCAKCTYFQDYHEERGRGWCHLFNDTTRKHHLRTHDCDLTDDWQTVEHEFGDGSNETLLVTKQPRLLVLNRSQPLMSNETETIPYNQAKIAEGGYKAFSYVRFV